VANGIVSGICLGFGIIFLFSGIRRQDNRRLNLLFALFSLSYAATLFNGIRFHNATTVEQYMALVRGDSIFVLLAFTALIWYVAEYTQVKPRIARDLHDAVTQTIYSAALIAEVLPAVWERSPDEGTRNLVKLRQLVRSPLAEMRTLLGDLE
jgi:hypothetical protein